MSENTPDLSGPEHEIEIGAANLPTGEPVVVLRIGPTVTVLDLQTATEIAQCITTVIARSSLEDAVLPSLPQQQEAANG